MKIFRLYSVFKMTFEHHSIRRNFFLSASTCWDSRPSLLEKKQNFKNGVTIGYGDSYLEFFFQYFKAFRSHAILHNAPGAVGHMWQMSRLLLHDWRKTNSYLVVHVTGLNFCFHVKIFLPSIFKSVNFCSGMSCNSFSFCLQKNQERPTNC